MGAPAIDDALRASHQPGPNDGKGSRRPTEVARNIEIAPLATMLTTPSASRSAACTNAVAASKSSTTLKMGLPNP